MTKNAARNRYLNASIRKEKGAKTHNKKHTRYRRAGYGIWSNLSTAGQRACQERQGTLHRG
jgi:hypothetical protein